MGLVKNTNDILPLATPSNIAQIKSENRIRRLETLFGRPGLRVEDVVVAVREEDVEEQVKKMQEQKSHLEEEKVEKMEVMEMQKLLKKCKDEFEDVMKEINKLRDEQINTVNTECENLGCMLKDLTGHIDKMEKEMSHLTEELERAKMEEVKLKEELYIAKNDRQADLDKAQASNWAELRNGRGAGSMAEMVKTKKK